MKSNRFVKSICFLLQAVLAFVIFTGCGNNNNPISHTVAPTATANQVASSPIPVKGGVLRITMPKHPSSTLPIMVDTREMANLFLLSFESLIKLDETGKPAPCLAESWIHEEGKWIFKLRQNVYWHGDNGTLNTEDVVNTLDMIMEPADPTQPSYYSYIKDYIQSYSAVDEMTLEIVPKKTGYSFLYAMTFPVMHRNTISFSGTGVPVGTGPFKVVDYRLEEEMKFAVNEKWWRKSPNIQGIVAVSVPDREAELAAYELNSVDLVNTALNATGRMKTLKNTAIMDILTQNYDFLLPNLNNPELQNVKMRQAIAEAIDKKNLIYKAFMNHAVAVDTPLPPDIWLRNPSTNQITYDTKDAVKLLEECGWKDTDNDPATLESTDANSIENLQFNLLIPDNADDPSRKDVGNILKEQLGRVGIQVSLIIKPFEEYTDAIKNGDYDLAVCGYNLSREPDLSFALSSSSPSNLNAYSDSEMDGILERMSTDPTDNELLKTYGEFEALFVQNLPHISLYFRCNSLIYRSYIGGITSARDMELYNQVENWYFDSNSTGITEYSLPDNTPEYTETPSAAPETTTPQAKATISPTPESTQAEYTDKAKPPESSDTPEAESTEDINDEVLD